MQCTRRWMLNHDIVQIATFDEGFDRVDGVTRIRLGDSGR